MKVVDTQTTIQNLNQVYSQFGSGFEVYDWQTNGSPVEDWDVQPGDIMINYDYCDDEADDSEKDEFITWLYDVAWPTIKAQLANEGYREVDESDGSGNGLYYGAVLFRK